MRGQLRQELKDRTEEEAETKLTPATVVYMTLIATSAARLISYGAPAACNGQTIGTSNIAITKMISVSNEPTFRKSEKR